MTATGASTQLSSWFLTASERGNRFSDLDARHEGEQAWSTGNLARPLIHGSAYFAELHRCLDATGPGDLVMFTDWQGNPDEQLTGEPGSEVGEVLKRALDRGVDVRALIWRSHAGFMGFHADDHREFGELLQAHGADVQLDMRVRKGGAHHQKFVVVRHGSDATRDVAFVGGIDLCHGRRDDEMHHGDPQPEPMPSEYGDRAPWHDVQVALQGPVVHDVETVFRERWDDSTPLTRSVTRRLRDSTVDLEEADHRLPGQNPAPPQVPGGRHSVQLLRTYPRLGPGWAYDFAPEGERSVARGYTKAALKARRLIYLEDQYLWGNEMSDVLVEALAKSPELHLIAVLPQVPDLEGWFGRDPQTLGRIRGVRRVMEAAPDRVAFYGLENHAGTPVYVHAKVCVIDDIWASIGSDNFCRRSWTNDSELSAIVIEDSGEEVSDYARRLRLTLAAEHLDRLDDDDPMADCVDAADLFERFAASAAALDQWHADGQRGPRPAGRLRSLPTPRLPWHRMLLALPSYRFVHDPDGRPRRLRRQKSF